jgi:NAD-reducing hydrogenase small subunit
MSKPIVATASLAGCFGCHMSLLDIDERILKLAEVVEFDKSPIDDIKTFTRPVDIGLIEGGCCNSENVEVLRAFRKHCKVLVSVGEDRLIPNDEDLPIILDKVYPCHEIVPIDAFLPGCPPSADLIWEAVTALVEGRPLALTYELIKFD